MAQESTAALPRWKRVLFSLILIVVVLAICEAISVWYLKTYRGYDGTHLFQYVFDPYKNILPAPNYVDTRGIRNNSVGFRRSTEVSVAKPAGTYRIFLMGGSTAYGLGGLWRQIQTKYEVIKNSQTIDADLERMLDDSLPGTHVEVINAAIVSTWTHHELIYLNQKILHYNPDMVLFLDGFNDFYYFNRNHDQFADYSYDLESRIIMGKPTLYSLAFANGWWLFRKFALFNVLGRGLRLAKLLVTPRPAQPPINVDSAMAGMRYVFPRNALTMWRRSGLILKDAGVVPVFMLQPMLILERGNAQMPPIERKLFDFNVESYRPNYEQFAHQAVAFVRDTAADMARDIGGHFIDLTRIYRDKKDQMFTDYCHLTPEGNQVLAGVVLNRILPIIRKELADSAAARARAAIARR